MKITIKTKHIEIEYQDDYSMLEYGAKDRIKDIIKTLYEYEAIANPTMITKPIVGTVEEIFSGKVK